MKSSKLLALALIGGIFACNKPSSTVMAVVDPNPKVQVSQSEIEKILTILRTKSEQKDQLIEAEASLKASNYVAYQMDLDGASDHHLLKNSSGQSANVITINYSKGVHNETGENISASIVILYFANEKGELFMHEVIVRYIGKTYGA
jgi:hypothetical protein